MKVIALALVIAGLAAGTAKKKKEPEPSLLDQYIRAASEHKVAEMDNTSPGSAWSPAARLTDLGRDLRASQVDDVLTVIVDENVNAVASGASSSARASSANASINALAGKKSPGGALANLLDTTSTQKLDGTGTTTRTATLTAALTTRVVKVLPGGLLLVEGDKRIQVNSEQQVVTVRGIVRAADVSTANTVTSTQIADLEVRVNGKGLVGDAIRRPNVLYRLLLGLLPF
jgi:flagellar L-ring protein precursor FlgH